MKQWVRDVIYGVIIVLFSIGNYIYAGTLGVGSIKLKVAQAGMYLRWVMILFAILGVWLIIRSLLKKPVKVCEPIFTRPVVVTLVIVVVYLLLLNKLGFLISSFLFVFGLITYYSMEIKKTEVRGKILIKRLGQYALCAAITTGVCYYLFGTVLTVVLPRFNIG